MSIASPPEVTPPQSTPQQSDVTAPPPQPPSSANPQSWYSAQYVQQPAVAPRRHGGAVAGLILVALGITILLGTWLPGGGAWFFLGLGAAFVIARVLTARPGYTVPAVMLFAFGSFVWLAETGFLTGLGAQYWSLLQFWPLMLVALGAWLLFRDRLPPTLRAPVTTIGATVLMLGGLLTAAAAVATVSAPYARGPLPMPCSPFRSAMRRCRTP